MNPLLAPLIINEVFPNPSAGSEWVEILQLGESPINSTDYSNFTISDEGRVIYQFSGDENWLGKLLLIELSGLNNGGDSVVLKNAEGLIIDEMTYSSSQKDMSWLRTDTENPSFILGKPSPLALNITPSPSTKPTLTPTSVPSITPISNPSPIISTDQNQENEQKLKLEQISKPPDKQQETLNNQDISEKYFANYQNFKNLNIKCQNSQHFSNSRLVFLGQRILKTATVNAIIGSSLFIVAAILLSYEQKPNH